MFRLASLFALALVTVAAASFLDAHKNHTESQPKDPDRDFEPQNRWAVLTAGRTVPFHAQFSLN
jgi:hypothetical protein